MPAPTASIHVRIVCLGRPPPPPPGGLTLYQELSLADPAGFELARTTLEDLLPTLAHVATSSVGGSVGIFLAD